MAKTLLRAREAFFVATKSGYARQIQEGEMVESDDPIVKGREAYFIQVRIGDVVEQATAAPGEKRAVKKTDDD